MSRYNSFLYKLQEFFERTISKSSGTDYSLMKCFDVGQMIAICTLEKEDVYEPHATALTSAYQKKYNGVASTMPYPGEKGFVYLRNSKVYGKYDTTFDTTSPVNSCSFVVSEFGKRYLYVYMEYRTHDKRLVGLRTELVTIRGPKSYNVSIVEDDINHVYEQLLSFN